MEHRRIVSNYPYIVAQKRPFVKLFSLPLSQKMVFLLYYVDVQKNCLEYLCAGSW